MPHRAAFVAIVLLSTSCSPPRPADILLFDGSGTSPNDVTAVKSILDRAGLSYTTANSWQLNRMAEAQLRAYRLLIVPGGNFIRIGEGLTPRTTATIRDAVRSGLNYLGICAGAFLAGDSGFNGVNLTSGVRFGFYSAEQRGIRKSAVAISRAEAPALDVYWEDGPELSGWGAMVARYPDGTPAVVQGTAGNGWVVLSGVHPEAPAAWRRGMSFSTPVEVDHDYAATLIDAALHRAPLPHF